MSGTTTGEGTTTVPSPGLWEPRSQMLMQQGLAVWRLVNLTNQLGHQSPIGTLDYLPRDPRDLGPFSGPVVDLVRWCSLRADVDSEGARIRLAMAAPEWDVPATWVSRIDERSPSQRVADVIDGVAA